MNHFRCRRCEAEFTSENERPSCPDCHDRFGPQQVVTTTLTTSGDASRGSAGVRFTLLFVLFMGILWVLTEGGTLLGMTISSAQTRGWIIVLGALASAWFINALAARPTKRDDSSGDAS